MNGSGSNESTVPVAVQRKRRRPPLSCFQCRSRKIRCDRNAPCRQCTKAGLEACQYVCDHRVSLTTAPFRADETQFSVFDQTHTPTTQCLPVASMTPESLDSPPTSDTWSMQNVHDRDKSWPELMLPHTFDLEPGWHSVLGALCFPAEPQSPTSSRFSTCFSEDSSSRTEFYGQSHWKNSIYRSAEVRAAVEAHENDAQGGYGEASLVRCKAIGKAIKMQDSMPCPIFGSLRDLIPRREVSDRLIQAYLRTFQGVLAILYVPSFQRDYDTFWRDGKTFNEKFVVTLILIMCIGSAFSPGDAQVPRTTALQWIYAVSSWLVSCKAKRLLNMDGLRIRCLLLLAHQTHSVKSENMLLSTGSLLQMATRIGLHIDPRNHSAAVSSCAASVEARRRLWAAVLELELQANMDDGTVLSVDGADYDCTAPLNVDDANLESGMPSSPRPIEEPTQSSLQILLMKTMPARLSIVRFTNGAQPEKLYDEALSLSATLTAALKSCTALIVAYRRSLNGPTVFQTKLFHLFVHRFFLSLHHPFALQARSSLSYYYSSKVCLDTALSFCLISSPLEDDIDWRCLCLHGAGPFRHIYNQCAFFVSGELLTQDDVFTTGPGSTFMRDEAHRATRVYLEHAKMRLEASETSVKCYVLISCLLAQVDALKTGADVASSISVAMKRALEVGQSILKQRLRKGSEVQGGYNTKQLDWYECGNFVNLKC